MLMFCGACHILHLLLSFSSSPCFFHTSSVTFGYPVIPPVVLFRLRSASLANVLHMSVVGPSRHASALS